LAVVAARAADEKLGAETVVLDVKELLSVVDAFVITSGRNLRQVDTLVDEIEAATKATYGRGPLTIEGRNDGTWVLMDYGDVLVHVFVEETRSFYDLEHLWSSAPRVAWEQ
jgi:ribosome-associated protein